MIVLEDEVEKTRYKRLLEIRNNYIKNLAQQGCSSEAIALLFSLSKSYINILAKDSLVSNPKLYSTELLFNKREELIKKLKQSKYSDEEISVIFFKGNLEKAEEAKLDIDLKEQNSFLESENKKLSKDLTSYKLAFKELTEQKNKLENDNKVLTDKFTLSEQKYSLLESDLIISQHDNTKLQEQVSSLKLELENLQSLKETVSDVEKENTTLNQQIKSLELELHEICNERNRLKLVNQNLTNENSQLQQLSSTYIYLQSELNEKVTTIQSLESEIQNLKSQLEDEKQTVDLDIDVCKSDRILYTSKEKRRMRTVYKACNYNRTNALEVLHNEGIMVSYRHLGTIVADMKPSKKK